MSRILVATVLLGLLTGCQGGTWFKGSDGEGWAVKKTHTKFRGGPEMRENRTGQSSNRWATQVGLGMELENGHRFGVTYRRRDIDNGVGGNDGQDNGVWVEWQIPIWEAPRKKSKHEQEMERRLELLEAALRGDEEAKQQLGQD